MQINRSTKKDFKKFFPRFINCYRVLVANSDLKTIIAADLNHLKTTRNVIAHSQIMQLAGKSHTI